MTGVLSSPTSRGRALLTVSGILVLAAVLFGQRDLMQVALLCAALPLASMWVVSRTRGSLEVARTIASPRVGHGEATQVLVTVRNTGRLPSGTMLIEEQVPSTLGTVQRVTLERISPQGRRELDYRIAGLSRGVHVVGPLSVTVVDPFGLARLRRTFPSHESVLVLPPVAALAPQTRRGTAAGGGNQQSGTLAMAGDDDVVPRPYRTGDGLRRIHWRASARHGELMVRHEEQPWRQAAVVVLDLRAGSYGRQSSPVPVPETSALEWAVSAAASVTVHLLQRGMSVRIVDTAGTAVAFAQDGHGIDGVLTALATVGERPRGPSTVDVTRRQGADSLVVAILGQLDHDDAESVSALRGGRSGVALVLDAPTWQGGQAGGADAAVEILAARGWSALGINQHTSVAEAWQRVHAVMPAGGSS